MYIHVYMADNIPKPDDHSPEAFQFPCLCAAIRRTGRILTKRYDSYLKPSGLKVTQFSMLANIIRNPGIAVSELADLLVMDQTTVTRNLQVLEKAGHIRLEPEEKDHRVKRVDVTDLGKAKVSEARPMWEKAQSDVLRILGREGIDGLLGRLAQLGTITDA